MRVQSCKTFGGKVTHTGNVSAFHTPPCLRPDLAGLGSTGRVFVSICSAIRLMLMARPPYGFGPEWTAALAKRRTRQRHSLLLLRAWG